jgi:hypothetical protein
MEVVMHRFAISCALGCAVVLAACARASQQTPSPESVSAATAAADSAVTAVTDTAAGTIARDTAGAGAAADTAMGMARDTSSGMATDTARAGADTAAAYAPQPGATAGALSLSALAGKWSVRATPEAGNATPFTYQLNASADPSGWTMTFPNGQPIPVRVTVSDDSLITAAGPFDSPTRPGTQVESSGVLRLQGDRLVGSAVHRAQGAAADSAVRVRLEGTRAP